MIKFFTNLQLKFCNYGHAEAQYLATHGPKRLTASALLGVCIIAVPYLLFQAAILATFTPLALHRAIRRFGKGRAH